MVEEIAYLRAVAKLVPTAGGDPGSTDDLAVTKPVGDGGEQQDSMIHKALTTRNVQLTNTISDISGKTGMAIVAGERDPRALANLRDGEFEPAKKRSRIALEGELAGRAACTLGDVGRLRLQTEADRRLRSGNRKVDGKAEQPSPAQSDEASEYKPVRKAAQEQTEF